MLQHTPEMSAPKHYGTCFKLRFINLPDRPCRITPHSYIYKFQSLFSLQFSCPTTCLR